MDQHPRARAVLLVCLLSAFATRSGIDGIESHSEEHAAPDGSKHIAIICSAGSKGARGDDEFLAGGLYLARLITHAYPRADVVVYRETQWPIDLSHADAVVVALDHGGRVAADHTIRTAMARRAGFMAINSGVQVDDGEEGDCFLGWLGGHGEASGAAERIWIPSVQVGEHPTTRGVAPFAVEDGWCDRLRFRAGMTGITPVLSAIPPSALMQADGKDSDAAVYRAGKPRPLAWAFERADGGRGFGFTGFHRFGNLRSDSFRTALLNGIAWVAGLDIPADGVASPTPSEAELELLIDEARRQERP